MEPSPFVELRQRLDDLAPAPARAWLADFFARQDETFAPRPYYYAFSGATRRFPKTPVPEASLKLATIPDFRPRRWTLDQLGRTVLLLSLADKGREPFLSTYRALLETADLRETVALFAALPLLPEPEALVPLAREGLRSNIVDVFDSIALDNPFPAAHFDEEGWNQMILKAIFIRRPLYRIHGIEGRANPALAQSLSDLAHERWAANRSVPPELWRSCQGQFPKGFAADVARVLTTPEAGQREAAALLITSGSDRELAALRPQIEDLIPAIEARTLTWDSLGQSLESGSI